MVFLIDNNQPRKLNMKKTLTKSQRREDILKKAALILGNDPRNDMSDTFDVSRSGYRHFSSEKMTYSKAKRIRLVAEMKSIHNDPKLKAYGSPRMTSELHDQGWTCSENTVATLMQQHGTKKTLLLRLSIATGVHQRK